MLNDNKNRNIFESPLYIFNPKLYIPAVVLGEAPSSPYEIETLCVCQSQKNCQPFTGAVVCFKF